MTKSHHFLSSRFIALSFMPSLLFNKPAQKLTLALAVSMGVSIMTGCSNDDKSVKSSSSDTRSSINSSGQSSSSTPSQVAMNFNRIATFAVCEQADAQCDTYKKDANGDAVLDDGNKVDLETVAEIITATTNGNTLIYTDGAQQQLGFIDASNASMPKMAGTVALGGEPTSVSVVGDYAVAGVNTSTDYITTSGQLVVIDITTQAVVRRIELNGQPDSVAVSPDGKYIAIAIENERDEDLNDGALPQAPAGFLSIIDVTDNVEAWALRTVALTDLEGMLYSTDPEPEFVSINSDNIAVITLQENNHIAMVDLAAGTVTASFSAGSVSLTQVNASKDGKVVFDENLADVLREPDGITWMGTEYFATANEGDLDGGSRGFSIFNKAGDVVWDSGNMLEHLAGRFGHYPEGRAGKKGNEPENVAYGIYDQTPYLFVNSERANLVFVFDATDPTGPLFKQALPAGVGPEGALAIPSRNLVAVASEKDARGDKHRSSVSLYELQAATANYPTLESVNTTQGTPIGWGAMSGLAAGDNTMLYAVEDSAYASNRIFAIDTSTVPAKITSAITLKDSDNIFAALATKATKAADATNAANATKAANAPFDNTFDASDLAAMINDDQTVNIDPEGIAVASEGGFWVASEGDGTIDDAKRPIKSLNFIFKTSAQGVIQKVITLPAELNAKQLRFGFEGVAEAEDKLYVAFQRGWAGDAEVAAQSAARIGIYDLTAETWSFVFYPLEAPASQYGGWVGLSDITALGNGEFLVLERDNQGGFDAAIKHLYKIDLSAVTPNQVITKTLVRNLMTDLKKPNGMVYEKIEGSAIMPNGDVFIINDNDAVDDNSGETQLINLGDIL